MKTIIQKGLFIFAICLGFHSTILAQVGGSAVPFLMVEPDARMAGMGNAGSAISDNASAIFWNPAGLASQKGTEVSITHSNWLAKLNAGLFYEYLAAKKHVDGLGTFAGNITYFNLGENERRSADNQSLGTFRSYDASVGLSYGFKVGKKLALGTGVRFIYSNLDGGGGTVGTQQTQAGISAGFDLAALYKGSAINMGNAKGSFSLGLNLANMGPKIQYSDKGQSDPIPTNLRIGTAFKLDLNEYNSLTLAVDGNKMLIHSEKDATTGNYEADPFYKAIISAWKPLQVNTAAQGQEPVYKTLSPIQQMTIGAGLEYWYRNFFAIRGGYFYEDPNNGNRQFYTVGAGIRQSVIGVDFSYIIATKNEHPLEGTPRFSILLNF